ncbi:glycosyltransferase [uncultured Chryseobacterium sp.]|uniref:glycosyltransferase family 2 protein n=1 Tax=uncultured Chryseobacterium sp. TaxID=259322 RepID=UPI0026157840|nr:glycosyltransferase [uncultured Chryseobacterium sp.]
MEQLPISVTLLTKNSSKYLAEVLEALSQFDEVVVLDNGSTDNTIEITECFANAKVVLSPFIGFGPLKNLAAEHAKNEWVINIDSDEVFPKDLIDEIKKIDLSKKETVYSFSRLNHYRKKVIKTCGWYPDVVKRMYHRSIIKFDNKQVHESLIIPQNVKIQQLKTPFLHYSFDGAADLINKMQQYSTLYAQEHRFSKKSSLLSAINHGFFAFFKSYILKKGITDGRDGFVISATNAMGSYFKYLKLTEANDRLDVSLIITTYNRPDALTSVLQSVLSQTVLPKQVIVADDGSKGATKQVIEHYKNILPVELIHSWQPDNGFRVAEARNRALAKVTGEYVILIDGDIVMHPNFIEDHIKFAKKKVMLQGGRMLMTIEKTQEILNTPEKYPLIKWFDKGVEQRFEKRFSAWRMPWINNIIHKEKPHYHKGIRSCNMSFFLTDALTVNGFNNEFVGWGREDSEFAARLFNSGVKRKDIRYAAIGYHLYHKEEKRDALPVNDEILNRALQENIVRCEDGVYRFISKD